MKTSSSLRAAFILFGLVILSETVAADAGSVAQTGARIPGYLDPATGTFTVRPALVAPATAVTVTGKLVVTINVTIDSAVPLEQTITCSVGASAYDASFSNSASTVDTVIKNATGTSGKCVSTISYIWDLAAATTNLNLSVSVSTGSSYTPGSVSHTASAISAPFAVLSGTKSLTLNVAL